jgi:hypothetical protein
MNTSTDERLGATRAYIKLLLITGGWYLFLAFVIWALWFAPGRSLPEAWTSSTILAVISLAIIALLLALTFMAKRVQIRVNEQIIALAHRCGLALRAFEGRYQGCEGEWNNLHITLTPILLPDIEDTSILDSYQLTVRAWCLTRLSEQEREAFIQALRGVVTLRERSYLVAQYKLKGLIDPSLGRDVSGRIERIATLEQTLGKESRAERWPDHFERWRKG